MAWLLAILPLVVLVVLVVGGTIVGRRLGYSVGGEQVVRCREGHLFTTVWVPFVSFKAVRLGWLRWQRCPVGDHWTFVTPVRDADLTESERRVAEQFRDPPIP